MSSQLHQKLIGLTGGGILSLVVKYFADLAYSRYSYLCDLLDMVKNMQEVQRVLRPGGRYVIVVGSNSIRGHIFGNWRHLAEIAPALGYRLELNFVSKIINHFIKVPRKDRINEDHILVLRKEK